MIKIIFPHGYLSLLAAIGFGVVLAGSGYQGMSPNLFIACSGIFIIIADMVFWVTQKPTYRRPSKKRGYRGSRVFRQEANNKKP